MGICTGRERVTLKLSGVPPEEFGVYKSECSLGLYELMYSDYFAAIKRFGFACDLTDEHLQMIAPEINLDFEEMQADPGSAFA